MLDEIKRKYHNLHDAIISEIKFSKINDFEHTNNIELIIDCENKFIENECIFEKVKFIFTDIKFFKIKYEQNIDFVIFHLLISENSEYLIFDFDCDILGENYFKENPNSNFIIKCRDIKYEVIPNI